MAMSMVCSADVIASGHPDWSPVMYQSGEQIIGIGPDLASNLFGELGYNVTCKYVGSWSNALELGKEGEVDLIVAAYETKERKESFIYTDSYYDDPIGLFSVGDFPYSDKKDLTGHKIAVTVGDSYGEEMDVFLKEGSVNVVEFSTAEGALQSLLSGETDAFLYSSHAAKSIISGNPAFVTIKEVTVVGSQPFYMLISKQSDYAKLVPAINELLGKYKETGKLDKIINASVNTGYL